MSEAMDADTNEKKMDMVILSGVRPNKRCPTHYGSFKEKNEWTRQTAIGGLKKFNKNMGDKDVKWANCISNPNVTPIMMEVKLCNRDTAMRIKQIFRNLKRDDMEIPDDMYISNVYTQATRVRVEIMQAIVRKCASNEERMFLHKFCNRPNIRLTNTRTKAERILTFTDLIENYGHRMEEKELEKAYKVAGQRFKGQMRQIFGILKDKEEPKQHQRQEQYDNGNNNSNSNNVRLGTRKRMAQEDDQQSKSTKKIVG
jgi:hypothetical protein